MAHTPLNRVTEGPTVDTGGRLHRTDDGWRLANAFVSYELVLSGADDEKRRLEDGALVRARGRRRDRSFVVDSVDVVHQPDIETPELAEGRNISLGEALRARADINRQIRSFFDDRDFLEVETRAWTEAPGTDPHLAPMRADYCQDAGCERSRRGYLHTSPELKMKRLLVHGAGPIYQLGRVWRNGEITDLHSPEFRLLEWYRPWQSVETIIDDTERLVGRILDGGDRSVEPPIERMTMREVVDGACGFDILEALDVDSLRREIERRDLLSDRHLEAARWDELFFSLTIEHLDPYLSKQGAVFVTRWPKPLAILARSKADDPRVAARFELYIDGVELANGFGELTDPDEQRRRFVADNDARRAIDHPVLPIPRAFVRALRYGLPPSAGVALGVDRLLLLSTDGADAIRDVAPFAPYRDIDGIHWP